MPLGSLSVEQLERLQNELQREVELLAGSLAQRNEALQRLAASRDNARALKDLQKGDNIMVPLTGSVYVNGTISDIDQVLVDIGTGYYVHKSADEASAFFSRRTTLLKEETDKASSAHTMKRQQLEAVNAVLRRKVMEAQRKNAAALAARK